ncbi:uncharacterized protein DS421_16g558500 [Arachis hypogaea]|nr:uncharacterized protein DS421_16g558500 [Arachis hypogaea]
MHSPQQYINYVLPEPIPAVKEDHGGMQIVSNVELAIGGRNNMKGGSRKRLKLKRLARKEEARERLFVGIGRKRSSEQKEDDLEVDSMSNSDTNLAEVEHRAIPKWAPQQS